MIEIYWPDRTTRQSTLGVERQILRVKIGDGGWDELPDDTPITVTEDDGKAVGFSCDVHGLCPAPGPSVS